MCEDCGHIGDAYEVSIWTEDDTLRQLPACAKPTECRRRQAAR